MTIQETINTDLINCIKNKMVHTAKSLKLIKSELQRSHSKTVNDVDAVKILKSMKKNAEELLKHQALRESIEETTDFINVINKFLPSEMSKEEVFLWVQTNIGKVTNFGESMKFAMSNLPAGTNGKFVSEAVKSFQ